MSAVTVSGGAAGGGRDLRGMTRQPTARWLRRLAASVTLCAAGERRRARRVHNSLRRWRRGGGL
ncbi:MAG: hypothetical protein LBK76_02490 [Verrucomicrobiales bacterium]|jgi:hypothetical protein|nr:hypothetical protein [Verrucomicrobiales bacterium]